VSVRKVAVLFSGGVESTTLLYLYLNKGYLVYPVYVKMGERWEELELENAIRLWHYTKRMYKSLQTLRVIKVGSGVKERKPLSVSQLFIPLRNLTLITNSSLYAISKGIKRLAIGSLGIYPFPDNDKDYLKRLESLVSEGIKDNFSIEAPFFGMEKEDIVKKFYSLVPYHLTLSCSMPRKVGGSIVPCGKCIKCKEREEALKVL